MSHELEVRAIDRDAFAKLRRFDRRRMRIANDFPRPFLAQESANAPLCGWCEAPFLETVAPLFTADTGLEFRLRGNRYRCELRSESDYKRAADWAKAQHKRLFLRSLLPCCVALDLNFKADQRPPEHTDIGGWERDAKRGKSPSAISNLVRAIASVIGKMPHYRGARFIAAVPPFRRKPFHLPSRLAAEVAQARKMTDLTPDFSRSADAPELKGLRLGEKWSKLDKVGLTLAAKNLPQGGESVILLDDKYQSGTTMHYVAMRMQKAGVSGPILGLTAVKTWKDDDNQ